MCCLTKSHASTNQKEPGQASELPVATMVAHAALATKVVKINIGNFFVVTNIAGIGAESRADPIRDVTIEKISGIPNKLPGPIVPPITSPITFPKALPHAATGPKKILNTIGIQAPGRISVIPGDYGQKFK